MQLNKINENEHIFLQTHNKKIIKQIKNVILQSAQRSAKPKSKGSNAGKLEKQEKKRETIFTKKKFKRKVKSNPNKLVIKQKKHPKIKFVKEKKDKKDKSAKSVKVTKKQFSKK